MYDVKGGRLQCVTSMALFQLWAYRLSLSISIPNRAEQNIGTHTVEYV